MAVAAPMGAVVPHLLAVPLHAAPLHPLQHVPPAAAQAAPLQQQAPQRAQVAPAGAALGPGCAVQYLQIVQGPDGQMFAVAPAAWQAAPKASPRARGAVPLQNSGLHHLAQWQASDAGAAARGAVAGGAGKAGTAAAQAVPAVPHSRHHVPPAEALQRAMVSAALLGSPRAASAVRQARRPKAPAGAKRPASSSSQRSKVRGDTGHSDTETCTARSSILWSWVAIISCLAACLCMMNSAACPCSFRLFHSQI